MDLFRRYHSRENIIVQHGQWYTESGLKSIVSGRKDNYHVQAWKDEDTLTSVPNRGKSLDFHSLR